jgi:hypothetical protein
MREVFISMSGCSWVRVKFCWVMAGAAFVLGAVSGLVWLIYLAG